MSVRPTPDQVLLLAPDKAAATAALAASTPGSWSAAGYDDQAVWGHYIATSAEPYAVAVDLSDDVAGPAFRCNCPSRKIPCKHAIGLLLLHANGGLVVARRLPFAAEWMQRRARKSDAASAVDAEVATPTADGGAEHDAADGALGGGARAPRPEMGAIDPNRQKRQMERSARMRAGLIELDRWLADRIRVGIAAPELAAPATWERVAARLVDAQCGGLGNRVKRVAAKVGQHARWHEDVLEEMALLHVLAVGAQHSSTLPTNLADGVHVATGLTVAKDDVLASVPSTARWRVMGESRTREDRITVQRTWLASAGDDGSSPTWAMLLSFGAVGNDVTSDYEIGSAFTADVHWYPGGIALRALVGRVHSEPVPSSSWLPGQSIAEAMSACGWALAAEPWLERYPMCVRVAPAPLGNGNWLVGDDTGSMVVAAGFTRMAELVCVSAGRPAVVMGEWSTEGFLPLTVESHGQVVVL